MTFYFEGHELVNPIQQLLICLYPGGEHMRGEGKPEGDDYVVSRLQRGGDGLEAVAEDSGGRKVCLKYGGEPENSHDLGECLRRAMYLLLTEDMEEKPRWGMLTGVKPSKLVLNMFRSGLRAAEADRKLRDEYFVGDRARALCLETARISQKYSDDTDSKDIDLYIGIPFCPAKCSYCSFVSNDVRKWGELVPPYLDTLEYEIKGMGRLLSRHGRRVRSIYIGGGTPSILDEAQTERLLSLVRGEIGADGAEFTFEAGRPETITAEKLKIVEKYGVGRISINPQTMNDGVLRGVGRLHTAEDVENCYKTARDTTGLEINMDLIAGLPGDDDDSLFRSVERVIALAPDNITIHSMARKKGAPLRFGKSGELSSETMDRCHEAVMAAGYRPYYLYRQKYSAGGLENVGFAKKGTECRYNVVMMEELGHVAAMGSGGVSKLVYGDGSIERITNPKYPIDYIGAYDRIDQNLRRLSLLLEKD